MMPACEPSLVSGHRFSDADIGEGTAGFSRQAALIYHQHPEMLFSKNQTLCAPSCNE
jgi:hypothetical protein